MSLAGAVTASCHCPTHTLVLLATPLAQAEGCIQQLIPLPPRIWSMRTVFMAHCIGASHCMHIDTRPLRLSKGKDYLHM
jgi:hypothetical protein